MQDQLFLIFNTELGEPTQISDAIHLSVVSTAIVYFAKCSWIRPVSVQMNSLVKIIQVVNSYQVGIHEERKEVKERNVSCKFGENEKKMW